MNNQSKYLCPICGADNMCTDGFKWGRAYCNSCGCAGPEVRTGYEESLDAPWREEARKQFVEVVNEHLGKRGSGWVKTSDRLPTEADADRKLNVFVWTHSGGHVVNYQRVIGTPDFYPYWMPIPPLPEVEE